MMQNTFGLSDPPTAFQQVHERDVARPLARRTARCAKTPEVGEVRLDRHRQFLGRNHPATLLV